jgi:hypothetical protein
LRRWGAGEHVDASALPALSTEDFDPDQWVRLADRLGEALTQRLTSWARGLARAVSEARDEFEVGRALTQARTGLRAIRAVAAHPGLPADVTRMFVESVDVQVRSAQRMLEQQAEDLRRTGTDRAAVEARLRTLRSNALTSVLDGRDAFGQGGFDPWLSRPEPSRRRVIPPPSEDRS